MSYSRRKKMCYFTVNQVKEIDYKDVKLLSKFIMENAKIVAKRITGTKSCWQPKLAKAIKLARFLGLLRYTDKH